MDERDYKDLPVLDYGLKTARERGTIEEWKINRDANTACAERIIKAINDNTTYAQYGEYVDARTAINTVLYAYSQERMEKVLAHDIFDTEHVIESYRENGRHWDGRISPRVAAWAYDIVTNMCTPEELKANYSDCPHLQDRLHATILNHLVETHLDMEAAISAERAAQQCLSDLREIDTEAESPSTKRQEKEVIFSHFLKSQEGKDFFRLTTNEQTLSQLLSHMTRDTLAEFGNSPIKLALYRKENENSFIYNENFRVRQFAAKQGIGLESLITDPSKGVRRAAVDYIGDKLRDFRKDPPNIEVSSDEDIISPHYLINIQKAEAFVEYDDSFKDKATIRKSLVKDFNHEVQFELDSMSDYELRSNCENTDVAKLLLSHMTADDLENNPRFIHFIEQINQYNPAAITACNNPVVIKCAENPRLPSLKRIFENIQSNVRYGIIEAADGIKIEDNLSLTVLYGDADKKVYIFLEQETEDGTIQADNKYTKKEFLAMTPQDFAKAIGETLYNGATEIENEGKKKAPKSKESIERD